MTGRPKVLAGAIRVSVILDEETKRMAALTKPNFSEWVRTMLRNPYRIGDEVVEKPGTAPVRGVVVATGADFALVMAYGKPVVRKVDSLVMKEAM